MGKFLICCRIQLKFRLTIRPKRWNDWGEFELDRARSKNNIAEDSVAEGHDTHNTISFFPYVCWQSFVKAVLDSLLDQDTVHYDILEADVHGHTPDEAEIDTRADTVFQSLAKWGSKVSRYSNAWSVLNWQKLRLHCGCVAAPVNWFFDIILSFLAKFKNVVHKLEPGRGRVTRT